ncbi:MAG: energy transducer TonB [Terriglobia bacterium]
MSYRSAFRSGIRSALLAAALAWSGTAALVSAQAQEKPADQAPPQSGAVPQTIPGTNEKSAGGVFNVGDGVSAPMPIYKPNPPYSEEARKAKWQGSVVLWIVVDAQGNVSNVRVARPLGLGLDEKAVNTVKTWKFKPGVRDGKPVAVRVAVQVTFRLFDKPPDNGVFFAAGKDGTPPQPISTPDPEYTDQARQATWRGPWCWHWSSIGRDA